MSKHRRFRLCLLKTDNGIGIAPQDHKKIFERFYRADFSRSQVKGYGLGLAICQSIVSLYNGSINITSHLGKGTTVTIYLPKNVKKS